MLFHSVRQISPFSANTNEHTLTRTTIHSLTHHHRHADDDRAMMITTKTCAFLKEILHKNVIFIKIHSFHWHGCGLIFQWDKLFSRKFNELTSWSLPLFLKFCKRFTFGSRDVIFFKFLPFVCVFSAMYLLPPIEPNIS